MLYKKAAKWLRRVAEIYRRAGKSIPDDVLGLRLRYKARGLSELPVYLDAAGKPIRNRHAIYDMMRQAYSPAVPTSITETVKPIKSGNPTTMADLQKMYAGSSNFLFKATKHRAVFPEAIEPGTPMYLTVHPQIAFAYDTLNQPLDRRIPTYMSILETSKTPPKVSNSKTQAHIGINGKFYDIMPNAWEKLDDFETLMSGDEVKSYIDNVKNYRVYKVLSDFDEYPEKLTGKGFQDIRGLENIWLQPVRPLKQTFSLPDEPWRSVM